MRLSHLALLALTLALLAAAAFGHRKPADAAPAVSLVSPPPPASAPRSAAVTVTMPRIDPLAAEESAAADPEAQRQEIESRIEASGGPPAWAAPAQRIINDWLAASGDRLLSSRIECHREGCIAKLRYRDAAALDAVTQAFEHRLDDWPGAKMKTPPHEIDGAIANEWILLPPDDNTRRQ